MKGLIYPEDSCEILKDSEFYIRTLKHFLSTADSRHDSLLDEIWKNLKIYINTFCFKKSTFMIFPLPDNSGKIQANLSYPSHVVHISGSQFHLH